MMPPPYLTYVGSFPLQNTAANLEQCMGDVLSIPFDYPNYIQLEDMCAQFLEPMANMDLGLTKKGNIYESSGELLTPTEPVATEPLDRLVDFIHSRVAPGVVKGVKACITGPFTLSSKVKRKKPAAGLFGDTFLPDLTFVQSMAESVASIARTYQRHGATYINLDEPMLSVIVGNRLLFPAYTDAFIVETLDRALASVSCLRGIHVCGAVSPRLGDILLQTKLDVLDHEFKDHEGNLKIYSPNKLERNRKKIAFGLVSSKSMKVEAAGEVAEFLMKGQNHLGADNIMFLKPDCGLGGLGGGKGATDSEAYKTAIAKLRNIKAARDSM